MCVWPDRCRRFDDPNILIIMMLAVIVIFFFFMFQNTHTPRERNLFANVKLFIIVLFIYELKKTIGIFIQYSGKQTNNNQNNFIHSNPIFTIIIIIRFFSYFESNIKNFICLVFHSSMLFFVLHTNFTSKKQKQTSREFKILFIFVILF